MFSSTSEPASKRPGLRQAQSAGWSWPHLIPIQQKHPLASTAGPPSAPQSVRAPSEKSNKSMSPKGSFQRFTSPSQISLPPSPVLSKPPSEKLPDPEHALRDPSVSLASTVAADGPKSETTVEEPAAPFTMTDQANGRHISAPTRASEASAETGLSSLTKAITATEEHLNPMDDAVPHMLIPSSEAAIPVLPPPTPAKAPVLVEPATPEDELTPIEGVSPVEKASTIETPSHIEEPFAAYIHSPAEEATQPPSALPMTSLPPPRITFQRATEDMEPREAIPAATMAETVNELPSNSHPADVTNVLPDPVEGESAPVLPPLKKRKLYLRKARNLAMRKTFLKAMLGRQLADQTKPALRMLAQGERVLPEDLSVLNSAVVS